MQTKCVYDERMFVAPTSSNLPIGNAKLDQERNKEDSEFMSKKGDKVANAAEEDYFEIMKNVNNDKKVSTRNNKVKVGKLIIC